MQIRAALFRNALASGWGKASTVLFRLVQVPVLLLALGVEDFGRWLVLASLPSWLTLANLGFGSVAANEMAMAAAANDLPRARSVFSTTLALVLGIAVAGSVLATLGAPFVPWERFLALPQERHGELATAAVFLAISVFVSFFGEAFGGRFRAARKAHSAVVLAGFRPWLDLLAMVIVLQVSKRFDHLAVAMLSSTVVFIVAFQWLSWRSMRELSFSWGQVRPSRFRELFKKGLAFQAFPLGNALLFQGNLLVVQGILGPAAVALFGTARTLVRAVNQMMDLANQVIWPELSLLLGAGDLPSAARLHRAGVGLSVVVACLGVAALGLFGQPLYGWWTGKVIELPKHLLLLFLLPIPFNALWFTSSVVHAACNRHEGLAIRYLVATGLAVSACAALSYAQGIAGAAISTVVADLVLIPYVLRRSLVLTGDSWRGFATGLLGEVRCASRHFRRGPAPVVDSAL